MSVEAVAGVAIASLIALILLRIPVAVALAFVGFFGYAALEGFPRAIFVLASAPIDMASAFSLAVVPLFVLMGALSTFAGLSEDLFKAAGAVFKGRRGSIALSAIGACAAFGAVCGSSLATAATMTRIAVPSMLAAGYSRAIAAGSVAAGGTLGILIPPSTVLLIYGLIAQQSVARLFMAALVPGLVLTFLYMLVVMVIGWVRPDTMPLVNVDMSTKDRLNAIKRVWHVAILFIAVIGGIYLGVFGPTEAAAIGSFGALLLGLLLRRIGMKDVTEAFVSVTRLSASLFLIVMASGVFSYFIVQTRISDSVITAVDAMGLTPLGLITIVVLFYLVAGFVLEGFGMILVTVPIVFPVVMAAGFDPVWFGVLLVVVVEIGLIHPPVGMNLFVIRAQVPEIPVIDIYRGTIPFLVAPIMLVVLLIMFPGIALWLPNTMFGR
ncbi:TRAP transporter large permease [Aminobacter sp. MSH1]|uniref:TRAP transporter large permease n=1 Tax=Aminobacter sp. MSH1 TaxID=374606 RepID=UPI000D334794|nr:TRAP transporter large permease [Aminobacter sp. MSH1]